MDGTRESALQAWWRLLRTVVLVGGALLSFLAIVEVLRVYVILRDVHLVLGLAFLGLLAGGSLWLLARFFAAFWSLPRAPSPPAMIDPAHPSPSELQACGRFLQHRLLQVLDNPALSPDERAPLDSALARLGSGASSVVSAVIVSETQAVLAAAMTPLDKVAERVIQDCVRDVMLAVVLSPYRSADLLVVVYRNGRMILQLAQLYRTRPAPVEQLRIIKDVVSVVATVNFLNFGEKLVEQLLERVPILGQVGGDVTQGIGAGLLTSATGHAALERCRSIGDWDRQHAQKALAQRMSRFARDVKVIFQGDVLPKLRPRFPDFAAVSEKVSAAFDTAAAGMHDWLVRPVATRGSVFAFATLRGGSSAWRGLRSGTKGLGDGGRALLTRGRTQFGKLRERTTRALGSAADEKGRARPWRRRRTDSDDDDGGSPSDT